MQCVGKNGGLQAGGFRPLLPLFSVAAFLLCGGTRSAFADTCAVNDVGITTGSVINTGTINCINIQNSTVSGNVTNASGGAINATGFFGSPTDTGIVIINNASVSGSVSNAGTITASLAGIGVDAPVFGGIANSGTISAFAGIGVDASTFSGGISNSGKITTVGDAIVVGLVSTFSGGIDNTGTISAGAEGIFVISDTTFSGGISNSGTVSATNDGIFVVGVSTYSGGIVNSGTIITSGYGMIVGGGGGVSSFSGGIANSGTILADFNGISVAFLSSFSGGISNSGTISAGSANGLAVSNVSTFAGNISNSGTITGNTGIRIGDSVTFAAGSAIVNSGTIIGTGGTAIDVGFATSPVTIAQIGGLIAGDIKLSANADVLNISGGTINGNIVGAGVSNTINFALGSGIFTYNSAFTGINQVNINSGTVVINGANIATNVDVNGGTLAVNGDISSASSVTVNAGGTLGGTGTVGNTTINTGGTLAPGNSVGTLTVSGSLTLAAAATYLVQVQGAVSGRTVVTGTANLAGAVVIDPLTRLAQKTTYTILTAGTLNGTFDTLGFLMANNLARNPVLSYVGNDVLLTLDPGLLTPFLPANAAVNQIKVAGAIDNALVGGSNLSNAFSAIFNLNGNNLLGGLTQISGETATGSQQTTFDAMTQFMGVMTDPFAAGRGGSAPSSSGATGFAEGDQASSYAAKRSDAYAMFTKAPLAKTWDPHWSVWAAGFGGAQTTDGNAAMGSNSTTSRIAGTAVGADYRFSSYTMAGFALAGGGTNFSVANGGSGRSDLFQAGAFVRHTVGQAYLTAALAYGWQDVTTDRTVTVAGIDHLRAEFNANAFSGRLEGGYRFLAPGVGGIGITPYIAAVFTTFGLPAYAESVVSGANTFALAYGARDVTDSRSELGLRTDKSFAMPDGIFTLRGRVAWAHDFNPDRNIGATFQTLPGASFVVNGAAQASNSELVTASAEKKWLNGWSAAATFEGEFSDITRSYAGKGVVRYTW